MQEKQKEVLLRLREATALSISVVRDALVKTNWDEAAAMKALEPKLVKLSDQWCTSANPWGKKVPKFQTPDSTGRSLIAESFLR